MDFTRRSIFVIATIDLLAQGLGGYFSATGKEWYRTLQLPAITPPDWVFGGVWTIIYLLSGLCALIVWNQTSHNQHRTTIMALFGVNLFLNIFWSYLFFQLHLIFLSLIIACILEFSVLHLIYLISSVNKRATLLLLPYALWGGFAIILNALVWHLN